MKTAAQELRLLNTLIPKEGKLTSSYEKLGEELKQKFQQIRIDRSFTHGQIKYLVSKVRELRKEEPFSLLPLTSDLSVYSR